MNWMKVKTAGLPRWAWIALFSGAVITGLYLRHRAAESEEVSEEEPSAEDTLASYEGTEQAGGLAAAGLIGPAQGTITPVESPYIPEAVPQILENSDNTIALLAGAITEQEPSERVEKEIIREPVRVTGGGSPKTKPHHKPPKTQPKKPPKKPTGGGGGQGGNKPPKGGGGGKKKGGRK